MQHKNRCPYCGGQMERSPVAADLSAKRRKVFNALLAAGPEGLDTITLIDMFFDDGTKERHGGYGTLRSTIWNINQKIKPLTIVARGGNYRIEET